jgi:hypothetical protein
MKGWLIGVGSIAAVNACVAVNAFAAIILMWTLWNMQHEEALASTEPGANSQGNGSDFSMRDLLSIAAIRLGQHEEPHRLTCPQAGYELPYEDIRAVIGQTGRELAGDRQSQTRGPLRMRGEPHTVLL